MGFWNANSDLDWRNECEGPYGKTVERTCAHCHEPFRMAVQRGEDYVMHPLCEQCDAERYAVNQTDPRR